MQIYTSSRESKGFENSPGSHFVKYFSAHPCILNDVSNIIKA